MSQLLLHTFRSLRAYCLCSSSISPVHKVHLRLLHQKQSRRALSLTAVNAIEINEDFDTRLVYKHLEGVERLENYRPEGYHPI